MSFFVGVLIPAKSQNGIPLVLTTTAKSSAQVVRCQLVLPIARSVLARLPLEGKGRGFLRDFGNGGDTSFFPPPLWRVGLTGPTISRGPPKACVCVLFLFFWKDLQ